MECFKVVSGDVCVFYKKPYSIQFLLVKFIRLLTLFKFFLGDEVGCFVEYFDRNLKIVHFIKNGQLVGVAPMTGGSADMFPSLGFSGEQCAVRVNWPSPSLTLSSSFSQVR